MGIKPPYTCQQGQFLAFIHHYTTLHGRPPAEAEIARFFQFTPPSVHSTILTLERRGLITRAPDFRVLGPAMAGSDLDGSLIHVRRTWTFMIRCEPWDHEQLN